MQYRMIAQATWPVWLDAHERRWERNSINNKGSGSSSYTLIQARAERLQRRFERAPKLGVASAAGSQNPHRCEGKGHNKLEHSAHYLERCLGDKILLAQSPRERSV
jgi:hypothetical protein